MSSPREDARAAIAAVGRALGNVTPRVVFVGGTVTALYPLEGGVDVRPTVDVDCVVDLATTADYYAFVDRLRPRGFRECTDENAPLCRLICGEIRVDIVATADTGIGPTNRWYRDAVNDAASYVVDEGFEVLAITPVYFVATKLEAFHARGRGDYQASHDLEDLLAVIAGLPTLHTQIDQEATPVATAVRRELIALGKVESFVDAVPGHFASNAAGAARANLVLDWLTRLVPPQ